MKLTFSLCLVGVVIGAAVVAAAPNCNVGGGVDFTHMPQAKCKMTQVLNGASGTAFDFDFNWCSPSPDVGCPASYVVQYSGQTAGKCFSVWTTTKTNPAVTNPGSSQSVTFFAQDAQPSPSTISVEVACDPHAKGIVCPSEYTVTGNGPSYAYAVKLRSQMACPGSHHGGSGKHHHGLTGGGIFLILFFVLGTVYLVGGFVYNYKVKELTGVDALPNVEFWKMIPGLVKDGCVFTWEKIKELVGRVSGRGGYNPV